MRKHFKGFALVTLVLFLFLAFLPSNVFAGNAAVEKKQYSQEMRVSTAGQVYGKDQDKQEKGRSSRNTKGLPVLRTEPANGARLVRPDAPVKIFFDENSKHFRHVKKQLEKGHFYVLVNGQKAEAVFDGKNAVEVKHGLFDRYTHYTVKFVLHKDDRGHHYGFKNGRGKKWEKRTYQFSFETGSALNEPRHAKFDVSLNSPKVTEGTEIEVAFTDDYGQPGYGAEGKVSLTEYGTRRPGSAVAEPSEFTVPEGSDGKVKIRITDTEAEKVGVAVEVSGPYPEDAARFDGEVNFRPGPAAKVALSLDREKVVVGQIARVSGTAEDIYGNPVEDGTAVVASASAGQVSNAFTLDGAFTLEFTAPIKKQPVTLAVRVDQCETTMGIPVVADVPAKITVTPEEQETTAGSSVKVNVFVEDQYGNAVEDGTRVILTASNGTVSPSEAVTENGMVEAQVTSGQAGKVTVTASTENGIVSTVTVDFISSGGPQPIRTEVPEGWIGIYTAEELAKIGKDPKYPLYGKYILMANLDLSAYENWEPIGRDSYNRFSGVFDGNGLVIRNLKINRPGNMFQGLFGYLGGYLGRDATVMNLGLENVNIVGNTHTGGLAGCSNFAVIRNCYVTGNITGKNYTGGLVGYSYCTEIQNCYTTGNITGTSYVGGLVGNYNYDIFENCYSASNVTGSGAIGGLIGYNYYGIIQYCYTTGNIAGSDSTGGLVGSNAYGPIQYCYSTGNVTGGQNTGGLVGSNAYGRVQYCYSAGKVTGGNRTGGLVGSNRGYGSIINCYWNTETSGQKVGCGYTDYWYYAWYIYGKTTGQMKQQSTYNGWDFKSIWTIVENETYPYLINNPQNPPPQ